MSVTDTLKITPKSLRFSLHDFKNTFKTDLDIHSKQLSLELFCGANSAKVSNFSFQHSIVGDWLVITPEPIHLTLHPDYICQFDLWISDFESQETYVL